MRKTTTITGQPHAYLIAPGYLFGQAITSTLKSSTCRNRLMSRHALDFKAVIAL
jgi:hypothetical protein